MSWAVRELVPLNFSSRASFSRGNRYLTKGSPTTAVRPLFRVKLFLTRGLRMNGLSVFETY